jgi:hypothetical protein
MSEHNLLGPIYAEQLHSHFRHVTEDAQTIELELVNVILKDSPPGHEQFSLTFRGPKHMSPAQKTYRLEHDRFEASDIFLVPVGQDQDGIYFEAVFNRILK